MLLTKTEKVLLLLTDFGMLFYWVVIFATYSDILYIAPEYMFSDYDNPLIVAWNLSFVPIDIAFSVLGLVALLLPLASRNKDLLIVISLSLMFCAGLMAVSFWFFIDFFDWFWWSVNIWLIVLPLGLGLRAIAQQHSQKAST